MASRDTGRNTRVETATGATTPDSAGLGARRAAQQAVAEIIAQERPAALEETLASALRAETLSPADAALARAIAVATFRRYGLIRAALATRLERGLPVEKPRLTALLATATAQILDLAVPDHAAVDCAVRLAKADSRTAHLAGLVNAVLRRVVRERDAILAESADALAVNTPAWLASRWTAAYGPERAAAIARAHLAGAAIDLTPRGDAAAWVEPLGAVRLPTGSLRLPENGPAIPDLPGFQEGAWWVQDAAAAIPARLLAPHARPARLLIPAVTTALDLTACRSRARRLTARRGT